MDEMSKLERKRIQEAQILGEARREKEKTESSAKLKRDAWTYLKWSGIALFAIGVLYFFYTNILQGSQGQTVHWHTYLDMKICGETVHLPRVPGGAHHLGSGILHTHDDDTVHVEGTVTSEEDWNLGKFMDNVGVRFDRDKFFDWDSGEACTNGTAGTLKMYVNDQPSELFGDYQVVDKDRVRLEFG